MELFIPTRINKDNVFGKGFGKKEARRLVIVTLVSLVATFAFGLFFLNGIKTILIATVSVGVFTATMSYLLFVKNDINLSVYTYIQLIITFFKTQKFYQYKRLKEWV